MPHEVNQAPPLSIGGAAHHEAGLAWRNAIDVSGRWALVFDSQGRNIAEVHRPVLSTGPPGRPFTFSQSVRMMTEAPQMHALLREIAKCDADAFSRRGGLRERVRDWLVQRV